VGSSAGYEAVTNDIFTLAAQACTAPTLASDLAPPQGTGVQVTFTSSTTTCPNPRYRFWVQPPGGSWGIAQDYSTASTFKWAANGVGGTYGVEVDVRDVGAAATYETVANVSYSITPPCAKPTVSASPVSPQTVGTSVTVSAVTSACPTPQYRFWVLPPGGRWTVAQDYGSSST